MKAKNDAVSKKCIEECLESFDSVRSSLKAVPKEGALLRILADSGIEMIDCYRSDSEGFMRSGDLVTSFAAINYAHAWIGCFEETGLFDCKTGKELFESIEDDESDSVITEEKMGKYLDITMRARKKIKIASPVRSFDRKVAIRYLDVSESFFTKAVNYRNEGDYVRAFAAVNYAHAWLDCGARIGLFDVEEDDVLFTLFE